MIKRINELKGDMSQEKFAEKVYLTQSKLSRILSEELDIKVDELYSIAEKCNVSIDWLMGRTDIRRQVVSEEITYGDILKVFTCLLRGGSMNAYPETVYIGKDVQSPVIRHIDSFIVFDKILQSIFFEEYTMSSVQKDVFDKWLKQRVEEYSEIQYKEMNGVSDEAYNSYFGADDVTPKLLSDFQKHLLDYQKKSERD